MLRGIVIFILFFGSQAWATYDSTWYQADFWSGEWPLGFSVPKRGIVVPARTGMDRALPITLKCELPYKAVFNEWNMKRPARYVTASKIVKLTPKRNFVVKDDDQRKVRIERGEKVEYLIYNSEGTFTVRVRGKAFQAEPDFLDKCKPVPEDAHREDRWLQTDCENGVGAWIFLPDLQKTNKDGNPTYKYGLWSASMDEPGVPDYGRARDLTDEDLTGHHE